MHTCFNRICIQLETEGPHCQSHGDSEPSSFELELRVSLKARANFFGNLDVRVADTHSPPPPLPPPEGAGRNPTSCLDSTILSRDGAIHRLCIWFRIWHVATIFVSAELGAAYETPSSSHTSATSTKRSSVPCVRRARSGAPP